MPAFLVGLLLKFPILKRIGAFVTSGRFLAFIGAVIVILFILTQGISFVQKYVNHQVETRVERTLDKNEIEGLKNQVETLKRNQGINTQVIKETKVIQQRQEQKAAKIEEKIDEQVKNGNDGYSGDLLSAVIDSL